MPWKEHRTVDLREEFVLKTKEPGASIAELCRTFGISRKTGYKWLERFAAGGVEALHDLSKRPHRSLHATSGEVVLMVVEARRKHPGWGPKKIRVAVRRQIKATK